MNRISSRMTFVYKRIFPVFWVVILGGFIVIAWVGGASDPMFFVAPVIMLVAGFLIMKKLVFDLVDEVVDEGTALRIRNGGKEDRVALGDIINIDQSQMANPPRVVLRLRRPSIFGTQIAFCAPARFVPFTTSPVIDALIPRIDEARRSRS